MLLKPQVDWYGSNVIIPISFMFATLSTHNYGIWLIRDGWENLLLWADFLFFHVTCILSFSFFFQQARLISNFISLSILLLTGAKEALGAFEGCSSWVGYLGQYVICNMNVSYMDTFLILKRYCHKSLGLKLWGNVGRPIFATCKWFRISIVQLWYLSGFVFIGFW